ncbi:restriction endonuclease subunit S [Dysgonomonas gadei]|uniref:restriction endonuclease subunit S n=1 Tax=Dysgonomonas gadei TaxID=156974 RepID=UPI0003091092|nr:restriction endonuclease subunit S [Dysgonomonas gadei]
MRFPEFHGEWKEYKVSDILEFFPTNSLSWEQLEFETDNIHNLHYGLIHKGLPTQIELGKCTLPNIKDEFIPNKYTICKEGDIAFADASEDTNDVAKVVEFLNCNNKSIVCGLHTIHGRDKKHLTIKGFKGYAFSSIPFRNQVRRLAQGTKIYSINSKNFDELYIGIPSKEEQAKIAHLLILLDERIATQNKIIEKLESLIKGLYSATKRDHWRMQYLRDILEQRKEFNTQNYFVFSVAVKEGLINQIEHMGRSFAAKDTRHYNVVKYGDIVYTKSPTGNFPYGIVKQSFTNIPVAVSPLYGVYKSKNLHLSNILHHYFLSPIKANNYLHSLIQKGAKNTINITSQHFLEKAILLPVDKSEIQTISLLLTTINKKIGFEKEVLKKMQIQKVFLLQQMFI